MNSPRTYHEGELAVQVRAGVGPEGLAAEEMYHATMGAGVVRFLALQHIAVLSTRDCDGRVWASLRSGPPGFLRAADPLTLEISGRSHPEDPLLKNLASTVPTGALVINLEARQRVRLNGDAQLTEAGMVRMTVKQVYGNCPQYIQARRIIGDRALSDVSATHGDSLNERWRRWVESADTFFLATAHSNSGLDASHRGGKPGFVGVESETRIQFAGKHHFVSEGGVVVRRFSIRSGAAALGNCEHSVGRWTHRGVSRRAAFSCLGYRACYRTAPGYASGIRIPELFAALAMSNWAYVNSSRFLRTMGCCISWRSFFTRLRP